MEDERIIDLYWSRSEQAIAETDKKYGSLLRRISGNILDSREDAEECVNDTYLRAWNAIPPERPGIFSAYLAKIVRNLSLNRYRKLHSQKRGGGQMTLLLSELEECIPSPASAEDYAYITYLTELLNGFLKAMPALQRAVFVRRYWYGDSVERISVMSGLTEGNVRTILHRCRKKLRETLAKGGVQI